jgi:hypothetical protein
MGNPTPAEPIILNADGSISMLIYQGRTFRLNMTHEGLTYPPTGYKCRFAITTKYGETILASADSEDGDIVFSDATTLTPPEVGTVISVTISDETMDAIVAKGGKLDCVLEDPSGHEDAITVGDWILWRKVTE